MGTNFYWKKLPDWFKENAKDPTADQDSIFMHIGKRSAAGHYCHKCGTTMHRYGTQEIHGHYNPDPSILFRGLQDREHEQMYIEQYEREESNYWYKTCPCCGSEPEYITSFHWTLMIHKKIIQEYINDPTKMIVDEYDDEFTCKEFMDSCATPVEYQSASEFS